MLAFVNPWTSILFILYDVYVGKLLVLTSLLGWKVVCEQELFSLPLYLTMMPNMALNV